ncbi:molybdopterin molybdotransferase MoeA [Mucilaginibacter sp. HMF5004]|uniref:molybdopterin molybdotransferase MoeA n=1 Tax=Mucilaginibacter rivuli TaxID=2857527 RepID=UPI001C5ED7E4|nr:molybdopterin molybdotransferase MoeA [Mucilaginibacter rivuli]MBW4889315.1 molybdopterin molybdotransferase MoeA [Mucilaginibacter rivuli]
MLKYTEAQNIITSLARSFGQEEIALEDADGRVLAEGVPADRDYPPFNRATMDGYAIALRDWESGVRGFKIQQVVYAGQVAAAELTAGTCYKIMTGAPVPLSADVVIRREDAVQTDDTVTFNIETVKPFQNIARKGEDMHEGDVILQKGMVCNPSVISLLASLGKVKLMVKSLPKVALFTTGDEVVEPGMPVLVSQIRNSNQYLLKSLLRKWLIKPAVYQHIADDQEQLKQHLTKALNCDMIITCGGVSAGDADYLPEVLESIGVKKLFHKVAIRPGKPIWCGQMPNGGLVFALPGNPFSCHVTFKLFIETYLIACFGLPKPALSQLPLLSAKAKKVNLDEFFPARVSNDGLLSIAFNSSGDIKSALVADALAVHPADAGDLIAGNKVMFISL